MLGQFTENFLITGFCKNNLMSFSTVSVAVAVRAIIGTFTKSDFNLTKCISEVIPFGVQICLINCNVLQFLSMCKSV